MRPNRGGLGENRDLVKIEIWSDVACPWCYIGKRHLETALSGFDGAEVEVIWRSFELDPSAPVHNDTDYATLLARKYGTDLEGVRAMTDRVSAVAAEAGLHYRFDLMARSNTFDAHRLIHLGHTLGLQDAVKERLLAANFCEGANVGDRDTLVTLAVDAGLDADRVRSMLDSDEFADEVRADEARAREIGISGVPFFLVDDTAGVSGAQPPERLLRMLEQAATSRGRGPTGA